MKHKLIFGITCNLMALNALCMQENISNEEIIKSNLRSSSHQTWGETKQNIAAAINRGVKTVDLEEYDSSGYTPLCRALEKDDLDFAEFLLKNKADPNFEVKRIHSSRPIFFAKSVEAIKLLQKYGASLNEHNSGGGVASGMNLLHASINCGHEDDRIFDYLLEQGLDPKEPVDRNRSLWHSLIHISIQYCPEQRFINRAQKLHKLGISPHQKGEGYFQKSAVEFVQQEVNGLSDYLEKTAANKNDPDSDFKYKTVYPFFSKMNKFLEVMQNNKS